MNLSFPQRLLLLAGIAAVGLSLILVRLVDLQIVHHDEMQARLAEGAQRRLPIAGRRGLILDAEGEVLARDDHGFHLSIVTAGHVGRHHRCRHCEHEMFFLPGKRYRRCPHCRKRDGEEPIFEEVDARDLRPLARALQKSPAWLKERLEKAQKRNDAKVKKDVKELEGLMSEQRLQVRRRQLRRQRGWMPRHLLSDIPYEAAREVVLHPERNPAFRVREARVRVNLGGPAFAHILGRPPDPITRAKGERSGGGIELVCDRALRGEEGWILQVRDRDEPSGRRVLDRKRPIDGVDVQLTMARRDQEAALASLAGAAAGALVVLNAETGAVLALANHPTFDPKDFSRVLTREQKQYLAYKKKIDAKVFPRPRLPIYATWDRARNGIVAPGSTMKPFTAIASLQLGAIAPDEQVHCDKYFYIDGQRMKALRCNGVHNDADLRHALVHSCNIYFQTAMHRIFQANAETSFRGVMHGFGFGRSTGVEGESSRMGRRSFRLDRPDGKEEPYGSRLQVGIGQGRATAAPMQVARAYAGIATGYLPRVHLVARRGSMETPVERVRLPVTPIHLELVRQALHATNDPDKPLGRAGLARFEVACKTGTAQTGVANEYNAWLAGFAPAHANRPPIAFAMLVERSHKHGGDECARRLAEFLGRFYGTGDKQ